MMMSIKMKNFSKPKSDLFHVYVYIGLPSQFSLHRRKDCLRQLLVTLYERKDLQTLVGFPYIDLQEEVTIFYLLVFFIVSVLYFSND